MSSIPSPTRRKKTKLQKIAELEMKCKALKEENNRFRRNGGRAGDGGGSLSAKLSGMSSSFDDASETNNSSYSEWTESQSLASSVGGGTIGGNNNDADKLKEALRALKRVTVKQEMTLATLRQKAKQRRSELDHKESIIQKLQDENQAYKKAHQTLTRPSKKVGGGGSDEGGEVHALRTKVAELELQLAREKSSRNEQSILLKESQNKTSSLRSQLSSMKERGVNRNKSFGSVSVLSESSATGGGSEDYSKLKRELAKKTELIATLQHELELSKDEIHDLKQKNVFHASFPDTPASGGTDDDFFESDDDDFWS